MAEKYRVLAGIHWDSDPSWKGENRHDPNRFRCYKTGEIVESQRPLDTIFLNKFEKVQEFIPVPPVVTDQRRILVAQLIDSGTWHDEDREFLETVSEDGFSRICRHGAGGPARPLEGSGRSTESNLGVEVTHTFQRAYDEGYRVWRNPGGKHQVTDQTNINRPLNVSPLDAEKVDKWLDKYLKEKGG